jgi:hypothetical protein
MLPFGTRRAGGRDGRQTARVIGPDVGGRDRLEIDSVVRPVDRAGDLRVDVELDRAVEHIALIDQD